MNNPTLESVQKVMAAKKFAYFTEGLYNLNIIGIRSANRKSNDFDDWVTVSFKDKGQNWVFKRYAATTDPGTPWLRKPMAADGTAIMVPGQYRGVYAIGIHGRTRASGGYQALEQMGKIAYVRDNNKDDVLDFDLYKDPKNIFWDNLKTNIHRASEWAVVRYIETYSAGCQVLQRKSDFDELMGFCQLQKTYRNSSVFSYTLLTEEDF